MSPSDIHQTIKIRKKPSEFTQVEKAGFPHLFILLKGEVGRKQGA